MALNIVKHDASFKIANNLYPTMCKVFNDINQQTLKKKSRKRKLIRREKGVYALATKVFENFNFSCLVISLLTRNLKSLTLVSKKVLN